MIDVMSSKRGNVRNRSIRNREKLRKGVMEGGLFEMKQG
jgi:hypothetical protein